MNAIVGIVAKGNCKLMMAFKMSFIFVKFSRLLKNAKQNVGTIAIVLVNKTLFHLAHCKFKKPSIVNCPAYVPENIRKTNLKQFLNSLYEFSFFYQSKVNVIKH